MTNGSPPQDLGDIQGNVLRAYGSALPHTVYLMVRIDAPQAGRRLLQELLPKVTDARAWEGARPRTALNIAVSRRGLEALGVSPDRVNALPPEFRDGMANRAERLHDIGRSAPRRWEKGLLDIELVLALHAADDRRLGFDLTLLKARIDADQNLLLRHLQETSVFTDGRDHFGYADGFGQPRVAVSGAVPPPHDPDAWEPDRPVAFGEFVHGHLDEDGQRESPGSAPFDRNGSFMVLRKLAQDVTAFRRLVDDVARRHFNGDRELVAAKLAGRRPDGTPLVSGAHGGPAGVNGFGFEADAAGHHCPLGAHIRRANPRNGLFGGYERTRRHRIIRRGSPYGLRGRGRRGEQGLVFVSFQANIARQFEVVTSWLNDGSVFGLGRDADVLAGSNPELMTFEGDPPVVIPVAPLTWTRGGEYLLLPSLRALDAIAERRCG